MMISIEIPACFSLVIKTYICFLPDINEPQNTTSPWSGTKRMR